MGLSSLSITHVGICLILLADINFYLAALGLMLICAGLSNDLNFKFTAYNFLVVMALPFFLVASAIKQNISIHIILPLLFSLYLVNNSVSNKQCDGKIFKIFLLILAIFLCFHIIYPNFPSLARDLLGSIVSIELVDYSSQGISQLRFYGIFSNPNYFSLVIIIIYSSLILLEKMRLHIIWDLLAISLIIASGSRAGFAAYMILLFTQFILFRSYKVVLMLVTILIVMLISIWIHGHSFRVFDLLDLFLFNDPSASHRKNIIIDYLNILVSNDMVFTLLFGNGHSDRYHFFFDGDFGNMFYTYGIIGSLVLFAVLVDLYRRKGALLILFALLPFFYAGGVMGNVKVFITIALLPIIFPNKERNREAI